MLFTRSWLVPCLFVLPFTVRAVDAPAPVPAPKPADAGAAANVPTSNWTFSGRFGAYLSTVGTNKSETSRDTTIATATESTSYLLSYEGQANWKDGKNSVDNLLKARYGRIRTEGDDWLENNDELRYDGVLRHEIGKPQFMYLGWGAESVFTGAEPKNYAFDPTTGKVSIGYGHRYEDFLPDKNSLEARIGVRAQQTWGPSVSGTDDEVETGIEAFARYEQLLKRGDGEYDVRFFAQYEGFSEFEDLEHITNLLTAGLAVQVSRYISVELGLRAYYETAPEEDNGTGIGYDEFSLRHDALLGLVYTY